MWLTSDHHVILVFNELQNIWKFNDDVTLILKTRSFSDQCWIASYNLTPIFYISFY